jgi:Fe-S cluster assembly protein SufD
MVDKDTYIADFKRFAKSPAAGAPAWVRDIREQALDRFAEHGFPTTRNEEWRFTRVRPLLQHEFALLDRPSPNGFTAARMHEMSFPDTGCHRMVFLNGHFSAKLSAIDELPDGLEMTSLREAFASDGDVVRRHLARYAATEKNPFTALNTAYLLDGAFVHVDRETMIERPIHLVFVSTETDSEVMSHPRNLIVIEDRAQATVIESYVGAPNGVYFTNAVTEFAVGEGARVNHYKIQKESPTAYHMATLWAHLGGEARFATAYVSMGGSLVRNNIVTVLDGEDIDCTLDGLYVADAHQHVDNNTRIEHARPHCRSHELYKGILDGRAKGVFNGKIHVHPDAQKTDAIQSNGCMLLSDDAQINTNPQLEIYADDVKCTHGAYVGQIDEEAVFYLRSRGIQETDARHMLIYAFANEVLERIGVEPLRERLARDLLAWLSRTREN